MSPINVTNYGVHWDKGPLAFLEQGDNIGSFNTLRGRIKTPFIVNNTASCNHIIPPTNPKAHELHQKYFEKLKKDPLVQAMLPVVHEKNKNIFFLNDTNHSDDLFLRLTLLAKMSNPIISPIMSITTTSGQNIINELGITNIQPLVLTGITSEQNQMVAQICAVAQTKPRTLIMVGADDVPLPSFVQKIETKICDEELSDLIYLPWENLGASEVKYYMQSRRASKEFMDGLRRN